MLWNHGQWWYRSDIATGQSLPKTGHMTPAQARKFTDLRISLNDPKIQTSQRNNKIKRPYLPGFLHMIWRGEKSSLLAIPLGQNSVTEIRKMVNDLVNQVADKPKKDIRKDDPRKWPEQMLRRLTYHPRNSPSLFRMRPRIGIGPRLQIMGYAATLKEARDRMTTGKAQFRRISVYDDKHSNIKVADRTIKTYARSTPHFFEFENWYATKAQQGRPISIWRGDRKMFWNTNFFEAKTHVGNTIGSNISLEKQFTLGKLKTPNQKHLHALAGYVLRAAGRGVPIDNPSYVETDQAITMTMHYTILHSGDFGIPDTINVLRWRLTVDKKAGTVIGQSNKIRSIRGNENPNRFP